MLWQLFVRGLMLLLDVVMRGGIDGKRCWLVGARALV